MSKNTNTNSDVKALLKPEKIHLIDEDGKEIEYIISKIPAMPAHRILLKKESGDEDKADEARMEMLSYCAHGDIVLNNESLVANHIPGMDILILLIAEMEKKNYGFFTSASFQRQLKEINKESRAKAEAK